MDKKSWIAIGATSALGLGVLASGAISVASAMPLFDNAQATEVPPISNVSMDAKAFTGTGDVRFWVDQSTMTPTPTAATALTPSPATPSPASPASATPAPSPTVQQAPAPAPQPVAPAPTGSIDSPDSPDSPDSAD